MNISEVDDDTDDQTEVSTTNPSKSLEKISMQFLWFWKNIWYYVQCLIGGLIWWARDITVIWNRRAPIQFSNRSGDVCVLTGGNRGIGVEVLKLLLAADMHVFIGCRNILAGDEILLRIRESGVTTGTVEFSHLDLSSLDSVREFAKHVLSSRKDINILINNAAIMFAPLSLTMDGFESQFQVNYLSHFMLTMLLLPRLANSASENKFGRIINVSSCASYWGQIDFSDLQWIKHYSPYKSYENSKLMQVISSNYLNARLKAQNAKIHCYAVHPGMVNTDLYENFGIMRLLKYFSPLVMKTPKQGADGVAYAALSPDIKNEGGLFLSNCRKIQPQPPTSTYDPVIQEKLWLTSLELCSMDSTMITNSIRNEGVTMVEID